MNAEIKKQIIQGLIRENVLVGEDILSRLEGITDINFLSKIKQDYRFILDEKLFESFKKNLNVKIENISQNNDLKIERGTVKIISNYNIAPKKRVYKDFVSLFNKRYKSILKILMPRQELQNIISIARLKTKQERESVAVVGIVSEINELPTGSLIISLEDDTGIIKLILSKTLMESNKELYAQAKNLVHDEVIGVTGMMGKDVIFVNNILLPEIPISKEYKKSPKEEYSVFIGDIHLGSKYFLTKEFEKFTKWINGEVGSESQKKIVKKIKYLFITGDLVEGVGIYPGQENDLIEKDIYKQYELFTEFIEKIPNHISIIICPGNHDAARIAEPQPPIAKEFLPKLYEKDNVYFVSSPAMVNISSTDTFSGLDVLMYHGYSFTYYADAVPFIRERGGQERVDLIMKFLLQRRHLAPTHTSTLYIPESSYDPLVINSVPDFFVTGHIHRATYATYRNISLINTSTWIGTTDYQEKLGLKPQPAKVVLVNLQTRDMKMLNFEEKKEEVKTEDAKTEKY